METLNIGDNEQKKTFEEEIMDEIERNYLITNFNDNLKEIFSNAKNQITKKKIYFNFISNYINSKKIKIFIKRELTLKQDYQKKMNNAYMYSLFYIYLNFQLFVQVSEKNKYQKIISLTDNFKLVRYFYKNNLINWKQIINILKYLIYQIKNRNNELSTSIKITTLSIYLKFFAIIIKDFETKEKEIEIINKDIKKDIFEELFEIFADNKNNGNYLYLMRYMLKEESIFFLVEIIAKSEFLSEDNKIYVEDNIVNILKNNFRKEHLNYFYKIFNKILIQFNNFITQEEEKKSSTPESIDHEKYFNLINKDFSVLVKINEILIKVIKLEKEQITNNDCYYCDKGFVFNNREKEKIGFKIKDINYIKKKDCNFCILFSFLLRDSGNNKDNKKIFSIIDSDKNEKLALFENGNNICLRYHSKNMTEKNLLNVEYNTIFNFFLFNDKNQIKISINNNDVLTEKVPDFQLPDKFQVFIGCPEEDTNEYAFNGIIYPIILFEANDLKKKEKNLYLEFKKLLSFVKNKYYLIAEEFFNYQYNIRNKKEIENENIEKIMHNYELYYGLSDDLDKLKKIEKFVSKGNNMILYINPYIINSSFNKKLLIYKDYNIYECDNKNKYNYFYEFNVIPSLDQGKIYSFRDNNIVPFFKTNNGFNFIIMQIESLFNYILLLAKNEQFLEIPNKNKKIFFSKM